ncbi:MAG: hypothetical protein B7X33_01905 [Lysobacterales bacterium 13-68-4]|nr:MAG: hypothetical protein B7X33_01905 [Xanthomonadales bacterium 13-68-4]
MDFDFSAILLGLTVLFGVVWGLDRALLYRRRKARLEAAGVEYRDPVPVDWARSLFPVVFVVLLLLTVGALLLLRGRGEMRRLAAAGLIGTLALNTLFTLTAWHKYDLTPSNQLLAAVQAQHRAIGYFGSYDAQFHFAARLTDPIAEMHTPAQVAAFAQAHPDGVIVTHPSKLTEGDRRYALLVQPFRSSWIVIWPAPSLVDMQAGRQPPEPAVPPLVYPAVPRP